MPDQIPRLPDNPEARAIRVQTAQEAAAAGISLCAFMLNFPGALNRYYGWLVKQGVLTEETGLPSEAEYREHLELMMGHYAGNFEALTEMITENETAEEDPGPANVRMTPAVTPIVMSGRKPSPRREGGRHRARISA